jgi:hypothetical protein
MVTNKKKILLRLTRRDAVRLIERAKITGEFPVIYGEGQGGGEWSFILKYNKN